MSQGSPTPTGRLDNGTVHFTEEDIITRDNRVSLSLLPATRPPVLLYVVPSAPKGSSKTYFGNPTPIQCYDVDDERFYRCRHEMVEENEETDTPAVLCSQTWRADSSVTIGTIRSHCRKHHWRTGAIKINQVVGQAGLLSFFKKAPKRQRTDNDAENNIMADNQDDSITPVTGSVIDVDMQVVDAGDNIESIGCHGLFYGSLPGIDFGEHYDFIKDYPWAVHSNAVQVSFHNSNLLPEARWKANSDGFLRHFNCTGIIVRDTNNSIEMENTTTRFEQPACIHCITLQFFQPLLKVMKKSTTKDYGRLPNALCPTSTVTTRISSLNAQLDEHRLLKCNYERKITSLTRKIDDNSRLMMLLQENEVPALQRLMQVHFRNNGSVEGFVDKCIRASEYKLVGHSTYQRNYIQCGKIKNGAYDKEAYKILLMTILMSKLGCNKLLHTYSFSHGGLSQRQMRRHINGSYGTVPNFKIRLTTCISGENALDGLEKNMDDLFLNPDFLRFLPAEGNHLAGIFIDGVATEEMLGLDDSQLPHQVVGTCRHCSDTTYDTYEDAMGIEEGLNNGDFHYAKEAEVFCFGIMHESCYALIPICISPTCKTDDEVGESTNTVFEIVSTIHRKWNEYEVSKRFIMSTYNSDGAGQFRKGVGQVLNKDLPKAVRDVCVSPEGDKRCPLLNLVGGANGVTASCDNDHLAKRFRARIKSAIGIAIGVVTFTKSDITSVLQLLGFVSSAEQAHRLFSPDDLMDVLETVKCLYAVGRIASVTLNDFPRTWRACRENHQKLRELRLLGLVASLMCTSVVGHKDDIEEEGNHLSVSEYLIVLSKLSHLLFILYRNNKNHFIAAQNYRNWQEMIKNMYISVTLAKVNGVEKFYWFLNCNTRIEEFFGILRSLRRGDMNFDALDLRNRCADASVVQWIYAQHPEMNNKARRLKTSVDRKNPLSWKGDVLVANVDEVKCWMTGRKEAIDALRHSKVFTDAELDIESIVASEPGVDMFRPYQKRIGVLAGDTAEYSLIDLEDAADDNEAEDDSSNAASGD